MAKKATSWDDKKYHQKIMDILNRSVTSDTTRRVRLAENWDYYYGMGENKSYDNLLTLYETKGTEKATPFVKINFNSIFPKLRLLIGELIARGFEPHLWSNNRDAESRRLKLKNQLRFQMQMQSLYKDMAARTGVAYGINDNLPQSEAELQELMSADNPNSIKLDTEVALEAALRHTTKLYRYHDLRRALFLDFNITNESHVKTVVRNGFPQFRRVNPYNMLIDTACEDRYLSDATYFGEVRYMSIPDCIEEYDLTTDQMNDLLNRYDVNSNDWYGFQELDNAYGLSPFARFHQGWNNHKFDRVLVVEVEFLDTKEISYKQTYDSHDNEHTHIYVGEHKSSRLSTKEKKDKRSKLEKKRIQIWRKATLIGGEYICNTGEVPNRITSLDNPTICKSNYVSVIGDYTSGYSVSLVDRLKKMQDLKNYVLTRMQMEITKHMGGLVAIDVAKIAKFYGKGADASKNLLLNAKAHGVVYFDSSKGDTIPGDSRPLSSFSVDQVALIQESLQIADWVDNEMNKFGINSARQGAMNEGGVLVGVQQRQLAQSSLITEPIYEDFRGFEERLFQRHADQIKICWHKQPELFDAILGTAGINTLASQVEVELDDYSIWIDTAPMSREELVRAAEASLAQGNLQFSDYLEVLTMAKRDVKRAILEFIEKTRKREEQMMQMQQQQMEAQAQMASQEKQFDRQVGLEQIDRKGEWEMKKKGLENQAIQQAKAMERDAKLRKIEADVEQQNMDRFMKPKNEETVNS